MRRKKESVLDIRRVDLKELYSIKSMDIGIYKNDFTCNANFRHRKVSWFTSSLPVLLHFAEIIGNLELGSSLFLHLLDSHARCNFSKSKTTVLAVNLEDTLEHLLAIFPECTTKRGR
jgi:hypothetical protein